MKINPVQSFVISQNSFQTRTSKNAINNSTKDTVTFGAKNVRPELSPLEQHGVGVAKKLMKMQRSNSLTRENISQYLNSISPVPIKVEYVSNIPARIKANIPNVAAHMVPLYDNNLELAAANIYIKDATTSKEAGDLIANTAHEFTHVLQRQVDKSYYGMKAYTNDVGQITSLARLSQSLYNGITKTFLDTLRYDNNFQSQIKKGLIPDTKEIDKYIANKGAQHSISECIDSTVKEVIKSSKELGENIDKGLKTEDVIKMVKNWITKEAKNEAEAYNVTISALKQWGKYDIDTMLQRSVMRSINEIISKLF